MASSDRQPHAALNAFLEERGVTFSFFQAVQLLHRLRPKAVSVGESGPARKEAIRFVHDTSLVFHASDIAKVKMRVIRGGVPYIEVSTTFLGLLGTVSPLATFFTEDVMFADDDDEAALRLFYDIFHHRIVSLFFRVWKKYRVWAGATLEGRDPFTRRAISFVGVDATAMPFEGLSARDLLGFAPVLSMRSRTPRGLKMLLSGVLPDIPVEVRSFIPRRVMLGEDQVAKLGTQSSTLGSDFTIGRSVVDLSGRFRVEIGPVNETMFEALLPGGSAFATMRQVVHQFSRGILEPEVELKLDQSRRIEFQLGGRVGSKLGVTTAFPSREAKPTVARFVLSDKTAVARSVLLDSQTAPPSKRPAAP